MIRRLLLLNGLAIVAVVLNHTVGWGFTAMFWWTDRYASVSVPHFGEMGGVEYYALRAVEQLAIFAVPAFLFVSGFFIAIATNRSRSNVEWKLVGARVRGLAIPYLFWSILIFVLLFLQGQIYRPLDYLQMLVTGRTSPPYYFVPLLIQLYLLSPLLVPAAKRNWKLLLVLSAVIQLSVRALSYLNVTGALPTSLHALLPLTSGWLFPGGLFWFSLGIVVGFNTSGLKALLAGARWFLLGAVLILFPLGIIEWELILRASPETWLATRETLLDSVYAAAVIFTFLAFSNVKIPYAQHLSEWGSKTFGIYLAHALVLEFTARAIAIFAPSILPYQLLFQAILVLLGLGVPLLLMHLASMKRSPVRVYYQHLFG